MKYMLRSIAFTTLLCFSLGFNQTHAQRRKKKKANVEMKKLPLGAFKMRNVGPAFLSGRIADIAVHPDNESVWYVAVGSGRGLEN